MERWRKRLTGAATTHGLSSGFGRAVGRHTRHSLRRYFTTTAVPVRSLTALRVATKGRRQHEVRQRIAIVNNSVHNNNNGMIRPHGARRSRYQRCTRISRLVVRPDSGRRYSRYRVIPRQSKGMFCRFFEIKKTHQHFLFMDNIIIIYSYVYIFVLCTIYSLYYFILIVDSISFTKNEKINLITCIIIVLKS